MHIKTLVDKIIKEGDIQAQDYSVADRVEDINAEYLLRIEKSVQIGSKIPISKAEATSETFAIVTGSNTLTRTIKDVPIVRLDFKPTGGSYYEPVPVDPGRRINMFCLADQRYFANEKQIFVENGVGGTLRVTYSRGLITLFTAADYALSSAWPSPDFLPEVFHPLLWLKPAMTQAGYYKKDRYPILKAEFERIETLFDNHYGRDSAHDSSFDTSGDDGCGLYGSNNR